MPRMLSGHLQGRVLSMISQMIKPKTIVEIGTYTGYSALCLAEGLSNNGIIHTIDINEEYTFYIVTNCNYSRNYCLETSTHFSPLCEAVLPVFLPSFSEAR